MNPYVEYRLGKLDKRIGQLADYINNDNKWYVKRIEKLVERIQQLEVYAGCDHVWYDRYNKDKDKGKGKGKGKEFCSECFLEREKKS